MVKVQPKPFKTVVEFEKTVDTFTKAKKRIEAQTKVSVKIHGDKGGSIDLIDGKLVLNPKEDNGKDSASYKAMLEEVESLITSGALYGMKKENAAKLMLEIREKHTKPQQCSQKLTGSLKKVVVASTEMVETI